MHRDPLNEKYSLKPFVWRNSLYIVTYNFAIYRLAGTEPEFIRQLNRESFEAGSYGHNGKFFVDVEIIIYCSENIEHGCKTTETFFDVIDENIQYPPALNSDLISAVSLANSKIIATSKSANFSLFSHEKDGWTEDIVDFREKFISLNIFSEQLVSVRNSEPER